MDNLVAQLTGPGIGTRTAQRLAFHILATPPDEANALGIAIADVKARVARMPGLREPHGGGALRRLRRPAPRSHGDLRRRAAGRRPLSRADARVPRPYARARRGSLAARRRLSPATRRDQLLLERVTSDGVEGSCSATNPTMTGEATAAILADG